ncbi:MAG: hypothetical protein QXW05_01140 [Ignisphaera sp.]|uniref:Uncharacterized protein n=1 Tax=Ignisphaera aggregans TaxID=334771 RepID=A0A7C4H8U7_9CREN
MSLKQDLYTLVLMVSSIVFMGISVTFVYIERYLQALLAFVIGIILLSSSLAILREKMRYRDENR